MWMQANRNKPFSHRWFGVATMSLITALSIPVWAMASTPSPTEKSSTSLAAKSTAEQAPDPKALFKSASDFLASQPSFRLEATVTDDRVMPEGEKIQLTRQVTALMARVQSSAKLPAAGKTPEVANPGGLRLERLGSNDAKTFWYDGSKVTVLNRTKNTYAQIKAAPSLDATLDDLVMTYGIQFPLIDLFYANPYEGLAPLIQKDRYIGVEKIGNHLCHHVFFSQETIDWQLWVDANAAKAPAGTAAMIRKIVITYKNEPQSPQYGIVFDAWELAPPIASKAFQPDLPGDAQKIQVPTVSSARS